MILPELEQGPLYNGIAVATKTFEQSAAIPANLQLMTTPLAAFICPSDPTPGVNENRPFQQKSSGGVCVGMVLTQTTKFGKSNYPACNGNHDSDGIFTSGGGQCRIADILDGLSNTIMLGERSSKTWKKQPAGSSGPWGAVWVGQELSCDGITNVWALAGRTEYQMNTGRTSDVPGPSSINDNPLEAFGSEHAGGANFLMADGAVRFISENIQWNDRPADHDDVGVFHLLGSIKDGQPVGEF